MQREASPPVRHKITASQLEGLPVMYRQQIPENYRDDMGHMNVMWYTFLFGCGFHKFADQFGFNEAYFVANKRGSFALETHIRYLNEVHVGKHVAIRSRALGRSAKRIHFMHFMSIEESGAVAAVQEHVAAHIDMTVRRMVALPVEITQRFDRLVEEHNQLGWEAPVCGAMRP